MLYVKPLTKAEIVTLQEMHKNHPTYSVRVRAHAILMSYMGHRIQEIAKAYNRRYSKTLCNQLVL